VKKFPILGEFKVGEAAALKSLLHFYFFFPHFTFSDETPKRPLQNCAASLFASGPSFQDSGALIVSEMSVDASECESDQFGGPVWPTCPIGVSN
jgi:hypothetical protein